MKNKALCVIDGTNTSQSLQNLLNQRCVAALPFAGRYRLVDLHYRMLCILELQMSLFFQMVIITH